MKTLRLIKTENSTGRKYTYQVFNLDKFLCEKKSDKDYVAMSVDKTLNAETNKSVYAVSYSFPSLETVGKGQSAEAFEKGTFYGIAYLCGASTPKAAKPAASAPLVSAAVAAVPHGTEMPHVPGKIEQILAMHKAGKTNKEIVAAGFNKSTVGIQVRKFIKQQAQAAAAIITTQLKKAATKR